MKYATFAAIVIAIATVMVVAQGNGPVSNGSRRYAKPYDLKAPPPLALSDAFALALAYMGPATNRFYCVSATCLPDSRGGAPGWWFTFSDTNGQLFRIETCFDKDIFTDEGGLLRAK